MIDTSCDSAGRLTADAVNLAISLDSFMTFDWADSVGPAVQRSKQTLAGLQRRRDSLIVTHADGAIIDWVLETINARLKFLDSLNDAMRPPGPNENSEQAPGQTGDQSDTSSSPRKCPHGTVRKPAYGTLKLLLGYDHAA